MLKPNMMRRPGGNLQTPTTAQKIASVASRNGLSGITSMQGGPFNIFDTISIANGSTTSRNKFTFFNNVQGKSANFTNWQTSGLLAGESLAVEYITIQIVTLSNANLNVDTSHVTDVIPFGTDKANNVDLTFALGTATFKIGGSDVFQKYQLLELLPYNNPSNTGLAVIDGATVAVGDRAVFGVNSIHIPTKPVLLPNLQLDFSIDTMPFTGAVPALYGVMVTLGRYGSNFAAKTTW